MSEQPDGTGWAACPICGCLMTDPTLHVTWHETRNEPLPLALG